MPRLTISTLGAALLLAACVSAQQPAPSAAPAAAPTAAAPPAAAPAPSNTGQVAAPNVSVPPPPPARAANNDDVVVVPRARTQQVRPPNGDPRTAAERMADIRAWDNCVTHAQSAGESDPTRPQLDTPEDICRRSLGMDNRTAVPESRRQ